MIFNTYKKYILSVFSKSLLEITLIFFSLILIINLFEEINFVKNLNVGTFYPLFLSFINTPAIIFDIFPFIFLISTQFFFIRTLNRNELFIFKFSGLTNTHILSIIVFFSFLLGVILIFGYYTLSSKLKSHYLEIKNDFAGDNKYLAVITENGLWIKDEFNETISITNAEKINNSLLEKVSIVQFDKNFNLIRSIESEEINIKSKKWIVKKAIVTEENISKNVELLNFKSNFDVEKINNLFSNLSSMSIFQLKKLKKDYFSLGYSTIDIEVYEHKLYSFPIYLAIMSLLSGIIMFNSKYKKNTTFNIILGIFLSVLIYYVNHFSSLLGSNGRIPVVLSIWLPLIILVLISSIGMLRINEK